MIFAVLDVSLNMGLNIGETDKVFCINFNNRLNYLYSAVMSDDVEALPEATLCKCRQKVTKKSHGLPTTVSAFKE